MTTESPAAADARIDVGALLAAIVRRLPRIILVTLALLVATFVFLMFQPRLYESSASILVEDRTNPYARATGDQAPSLPANTAGVISSQIELIRSRDTLLTVIDRLDLRSVSEFNGRDAGFSPMGMIAQLVGSRTPAAVSVDQVVLNNLNDRLTVVQERDSAIISVLVRSTDPTRAAEIANAIAEAHVTRRAGLTLSDTAEASGWLGEEITRLRGSVREAESAVAEFRVDNDLFTGQNNTSLLDQQLSTISTQITAAQERKNAALSRASLIRGLVERGQPIEGVADVRDSVVIQQLSQEKARLQGELAQRSATLLSNHPAIRALNAQISELDNQIALEGQRVAAALEAEAQIEADLETSLTADLDRAKGNASTATLDTVTLDGLVREAAAQRDLLEAYLRRFTEASSRVDSNSALPDVRVVSFAAPSITPASPKTSLIMTAVGLVSLALQIGAIAFGELMSGRALTQVAPLPVRRQDELDAVPFDEAELEPDQRWQEPETTAQAGFAYEARPVIEVEPEAVYEPTPELIELVDVAPEAETPQSEVQPEPVKESEFAAASAFIRSLMNPAPTAKDEEERFVEAIETDDADQVVAPASPSEETRTVGVLRYPDLVADLVLGRTHLLLLADVADDLPSRQMAEELVGDALGKGLSVALIDAGTGVVSDGPGITDLSAGQASFGDVVQKSADNSFAEVSWGQGDALHQSSTRPLTLAEALGDIYEVVVVLTGHLGTKSSLALFAELGGRVVLVTGDAADADAAEAARRNLQDNGLEHVEIAAFAEPVAA